MKFNTVTFADGRRLFIIEEFYSWDFYKEILDLFLSYKDNPDNWKDLPEYSHNPGRLVYAGNSPVVDKLNEIAKSPEVINWLSTVLNKEISLIDLSLWLDLPGYIIPPHYDTVGYFDHAIQIYIPEMHHYFEMLGTCIFTDAREPLFELHYRPNRGYMMDKATTILHGLNHGIPPGYTRHSVYMRYNS